MKNNNKNRKLKFIRAKNRLRIGETSFFVYRKITNQYLKIAPENHISEFINYSKKQLLRVYKLSNLNKSNYMVEYSDDDFIRDMKTERVELRLK